MPYDSFGAKLFVQLHVGEDKPTEELFVPVTDREYGTKPNGGLWTSTYDPALGSDWVQWCLAESFRGPEFEAHLLHFPSDVKVLRIDSYSDLQKAYSKYGPPPNCERFGIHITPSFEAISEDYDAVHLTDNGQGATRLTSPLSLYGWDCESVLWLRWCFTHVESIGIMRFNDDGVAV